MKRSLYQTNLGLRLLLLMAAVLTSHQASADVATVKQQYGSFVVLGQSPAGENFAIARTVIEPNLACPSLSVIATDNTQNRSSQPMVTRNNRTQFPVIVCEALVSFDVQYQLNFANYSVVLPIAKTNPQKIQVFGDTGCKTSDCALGTPAQPFKSLADSGAIDKPDLVLHMGDFNYRGTGGAVLFTTKNKDGQWAQKSQWTYDGGDDLTQAEHCGTKAGTPFYSQSAANANRPDSWQYWHDDLFMSAQKLMAAAPWIVARGNHELCSRAGPGYFYFLDPHSNLIEGQQQLSCPAVDASKGVMANTLQIPNYIVSFDKLDIAVIDSANACDSFVNSPFMKVYKKVFADLASKVSKANTWLVTHRPIWGVQSYQTEKSTGCTSDNEYSCINQMMQQAIAAQPEKSLPDSVKLILTGHMHKFESVTFNKGENPPNIVVGSSGVALYGVTPAPSANVLINNLPANVVTTNSQVSNNGKTVDAFGFLNIELDGAGGWQGQLVDPARNLILANCSSKQNLAQGVCELAKGITVVDN
ncbi:MAG: hypothetical protein ACI9XU_000147 [Arenicella sp.]|jgi:hypothetical protein